MLERTDEKTVPESMQFYAEQAPEAPALLDFGRAAMTYAALAQQCDRLRASLIEAGVRHGARIAIVHAGGSAMAAAQLATWTHAATVPLSPSFTHGEFLIHMHDRQAEVLLIDPALRSPAADAARQLGLPIIEIHTNDPAVAGSIEFVARGDCELPVAEPDSVSATENDLIFVLATSGTSDCYKVVPVRHRHAMARARHIAHLLGLTSSDRCINMMPMHHIGGLSAGLCATVFSGGAFCSMTGGDTRQFFGALEELQPTYVAAAFTSFFSILQQADSYPLATNNARKHLRMLRTGGGRLDANVARNLEKTFGVPVVQAYGSSETGFVTCTDKLSSDLESGFVGTPVCCGVRIVDEDGAELVTGQARRSLRPRRQCYRRIRRRR